MIKVDKVLDWHKEQNGKHLYMVTYRHAENNAFYGGFLEFITPEDMPKRNQQFESVRALEDFCRGVKNEKKNML